MMMNWNDCSRRSFSLAAACFGASVLVLTTGGCEARDSKWNASTGAPDPVGLMGSVALMDEELSRVIFVHSEKRGKISTSAFEVGTNITSVQASLDKSRLFVLSRGVFPQKEPDDEGPQLLVFDGGTKSSLKKSFQLDDPMKKLALDPEGKWVAVYEGDASVTNPNELVLLSLTGKSGKSISKTIRSFGGAPEELIFTDALDVPEGETRRFLVVRTDRDITLVDLENIEKPEVTVRLPDGPDGNPMSPAQIVYSRGESERDDDTRFAVRMSGSSDVVLLQLGRPSESAKERGQDFSVTVNIVDAGGVPAAIDFVRTDGGLRLAAVLSGERKATLVDPSTTLSESVTLPHSFTHMTRITSLVEETPDGGDVALLWGNSPNVAFWSLGSTSSTPFRSVDSTALNRRVERVIDVPSPNEHLKVLVGQGGQGFYVLDLKKRESFPLNTQSGGFFVQVSADGERLWVTRPGATEFSAVRLSNLHPATLAVEPAVDQLFDIERDDGGRSALALHLEGSWGVTVFDAEQPSSSETSYYPALQLEGY